MSEADIDRSACACIVEAIRHQVQWDGIPGVGWGYELKVEDAGGGVLIVWIEEQPQRRYRITVTAEPRA